MLRTPIFDNCILPLYGMEILPDGKIKTCCMYQPDFEPEHKVYDISEYDEWWNHGVKRIQDTFANGEVPKGCKICYDHDNNITSGLRRGSTIFFKHLYAKDVARPSPEWLELKFGNYCNLKCIMCSAGLSSQIENEQRAHLPKFEAIEIYPNFIKHLKWWEDPKIFPKVLEIAKNAKYISFSGGEPLMAPQILEILEAIDREKCLIRINTNLTRLNYEHLKIFSTIKNIEVAVSLDGVEEHHEYVRFGSSWHTIENNITKILNIQNVKLIFTYLLQHTSIYTFPRFYNLIKKYNKSIIMSTVYDNSIKFGGLTINSVPPNEIEKFTEWLKNNPTLYDPILYKWLNMYKFTNEAHLSFVEYINLIDSIRNTDFKKTFNINW